MIQIHKILKGSNQVTWFAPPALTESRKMNMPQYCSELRAKFFTNRVSNHWNKLSDETYVENKSTVSSAGNRLEIDLNGYYSSPELRVTR